MCLQDLRAINQTVAAEADQAWLSLAHSVQRHCPLLCAPYVEDLVTGFDYRAVDHSGNERSYLARYDRDHDLVEQRHPSGYVPESDLRTPKSKTAHRQQVVIVKALGDLSDSLERGACRFDVPSLRAPDRGRHK